jgi:hypothetical protein
MNTSIWKRVVDYIYTQTIYCTLELVENERKRRQKGKLRMDNPETLATMNTQDTSRRQINRQKYDITEKTKTNSNTDTNNNGK